MIVVGLDGWRKGWIAVVLEDGRYGEAVSFTQVADVFAAYQGAAAVAVDMPIGLPDTGRRTADRQVRDLLGSRRSSVFFTPPRDVVYTTPYAAANALAKQRHGFGISKQSYMLRDKIIEVDRLAANHPLFEIHPELVFTDLAGNEMASKRSYEGLKTRDRLLRAAGIAIPDDIGPAGVVPIDDVFDAAAAAIAAGRIANGKAIPVPDPPEIDGTGLAMAIWR